jgi:hypothetical protein
MRYPRDRSSDEREAIVLAVRSAVDEIDRGDKCEIDVGLVAAFLCAAWPTLESQNQ